MAKKPRILFVCEESLSRCQMAEGFARYLAGAAVSVESAGPVSAATHPYCQWAMNEAGIDITHFSIDPLTSKDLASFTHVVTLGPESKDSCRQVPSGVRIDHWGIPDPGKVRGNPTDMILAFRSVRNEIEKRVKSLISGALNA
ncbi:MAG: arsenate reductase [Acidobacteriota bacterium]|nr:MAG: arsenate reductase [Acidobacteriota bacterium]